MSASDLLTYPRAAAASAIATGTATAAATGTATATQDKNANRTEHLNPSLSEVGFEPNLLLQRWS